MDARAERMPNCRIIVGWSRIERQPDADSEKKDSVKLYNRNRRASEQGRNILAELLKQEYGLKWKGEEDLGRGEKGKPYLLSYPEIYFNLSHSGDYVSCCIGRVPVGIDIQYQKAGRLEQMAEKLFTDKEKEEFVKSGGALEVFYKYWTKKESYLKYTGQGISCDLSGLRYEGAAFRELHLWTGYSGMLCVPDSWTGKVEVMAEIV